MNEIDNLLVRLAEVRSRQGDPREVGAPAARERLMERIALLERYRQSIHRRRRTVAETEETAAALRTELNRWHQVEARMHRELVSAQERLAALPMTVSEQERRLAEGGVVAMERQVEWSRSGPPREAGMVVSGEPFDSAFKVAFGLRPHESSVRPPGEIQSRLSVVEPELLEARVRLDRELASLAETLLELERVAA